MVALRHPARHFIVYLLSKRVLDVKAVLKHMGDLLLPTPPEDYDLDDLTQDILRLRATLTFPSPFLPRAEKLSPAVETWLRHWRVHDMWRGHPHAKAALQLLTEPLVRHQLELLLLGPLTARDIADRLCARFGLEPSVLNPGIVRMYSHYFWDTSALDPTQWKKFLRNYYPDSHEEYRAALGAPRSSAGAAFVIAIADKDPQLLGPAERYEAASSMAFAMLMRHSNADDQSTSRVYAAATALNMMRMADEELDKHRGGSTDLIEELRRLKTVYDQNKPKTILEANYVQRTVIDVPAETPNGND